MVQMADEALEIMVSGIIKNNDRVVLKLHFRAKRALWLRTKFGRNRIATIVIASEASTIQYDESQAFTSSDSFKPIAITSLK